MEWSNAKVLEFIDALKTEPTLWNPKSPTYKNRTVNHEAWLSVQGKLSFPVTVKAMRRMKAGLLVMYRGDYYKYMTSLKSANQGEPVFKTTWFAYNALNSFLGPVYMLDYAAGEMIMHDALDDNVPNAPPANCNAVNNGNHAISRCDEDIGEADTFTMFFGHCLRSMKNFRERRLVMQKVHRILFDALRRCNAGSGPALRIQPTDG